DFFLLTVVRAACDHHQRTLWDPQAPTQILRAPLSIERGERIELGIAGHPDPLQWSPKPENALGLLIFAHQKQIDVLQWVRDQIEQHSILAKMVGRKTAVDQYHSRAAAFSGAYQVGPYLRVFEHEEIGLNRFHRPTRRPPKIIGRVEHR